MIRLRRVLIGLPLGPGEPGTVPLESSKFREDRRRLTKLHTKYSNHHFCLGSVQFPLRLTLNTGATIEMSPTISWFPASGALRRLCARCKAQQISPFNTSRRLNSSFLAPSSRTSNQERHNTNANFVATMKSTPSVKEPPPQPLMDEIDNPLEWLHPMRPYKPRTGMIKAIVWMT